MNEADQARLSEIEARTAAATKGSWEAARDSVLESDTSWLVKRLREALVETERIAILENLPAWNRGYKQGCEDTIFDYNQAQS